MPYTPSSKAQAVATAAGNNQAALATPLAVLKTSIAGGNLAPAAFFDALQTSNAYTEISAFTNSWANYASGFNTAAYYIDACGCVHLKGVIKSGGIGSAAFQLPAGFRPPAIALFSTISNGAVGRVDIDSSGNVIPQAPSTNTWVSLEGISFLATQ